MKLEIDVEKVLFIVLLYVVYSHCIVQTNVQTELKETSKNKLKKNYLMLITFMLVIMALS